MFSITLLIFTAKFPSLTGNISSKMAMLFLSVTATILSTTAGKLCSGLHIIFKKKRQREHELLQEDNYTEFRELITCAEPYEEFLDVDLRPKNIYWFYKCALITIAITLASLLIILVCFLFTPSISPCVNYMSYEKSTVILRFIYDCLAGVLLQMWFAVQASFLLSIRQVWKMNIMQNHLLASMVDVGYRCYLLVRGKYPCRNGNCYVLSAVWLINSCLSATMITIKSQNGWRNRIKLFFVISSQHLFSLALICIINEIVIPFFAGLPGRQQIFFTVVVMTPCFIARLISRAASQSKNVPFYPSKLYLLSASIDILVKLEYRFLQAYIRRPETYILMSFIQSFLAFFERISILLTNYILMLFIKKYFKGQQVNLSSPVSRRIMADLIIIGFVSEIVTAILPPTFIYFIFRVRQIRIQVRVNDVTYSQEDHFLDYCTRAGATLAITFVFLLASIYIVSRYVNLPVVNLWMKTWKEKSLFTFCTITGGVLYGAQNLITKPFYQMQNLEYNSTQPIFICNSSYHIFW